MHKSGAILVLLSVLQGTGVLLNHTFGLPAGTYCAVIHLTDGASDLDGYTALEQARKIHDSYGISYLFSQGKVFTVDSNTHVLVLDSSVRLGGDFFYRKVRILSGTLTGKALWISRNLLRVNAVPR